MDYPDITSLVRPLTRGPGHHLFGYYGVRAVDGAQRRHLALRVPFHDHPPGPGDAAEVGLADLANGCFTSVARTCAWNLQQGAMLSWIHDRDGERFTFNDWADGRTVARVVDPGSGRIVRTLAQAIACVSEDGRRAWGRDYARSYRCRTVTGYASTLSGPLIPHPTDDGVWTIDLASGAARLALSIADVAAAMPGEVPAEAPAWFDHLHPNPSGTRLLFIFRHVVGKGWASSLWTCTADGTDLRQLIPPRHRVSHFAWIDDQRILISSDLGGSMAFATLVDGEAGFTPFPPGLLPADGHATYSPDRRWLLSDAYPTREDPRSPLLLVDLTRQRRIDLCRLDAPVAFRGDARCDLHPRWLPDGSGFTIDSIHAGDRQIYRIDLARILAAAGDD